MVVVLLAVDELPVPPLDPPPASPEPLEPTGLVGGTPSVPVASEPESVLDEAPDVVDVLMVLMEPLILLIVLMLEFAMEDCAWGSD